VSLSFSAERRIFLHTDPTDMRRSFDRLSGMVRECLKMDPLCGDYYVFCNRRRTMMKIIYWDGDGFAIWHKRLEKGLFRPGMQRELDRGRLMMILEGIEVERIRRTPRYRRNVFCEK